MHVPSAPRPRRTCSQWLSAILVALPALILVFMATEEALSSSSINTPMVLIILIPGTLLGLHVRALWQPDPAAVRRTSVMLLTLYGLCGLGFCVLMGLIQRYGIGSF